jgi:hypothetical protein
MKARAKSSHRPQIQRKEIEEQRAIRFGRQRNHLSFLIRARVVVNPLEVGGFPAKAGTVIHELAIDFPRGKINKWHYFLELTSPLLIA